MDRAGSRRRCRWCRGYEAQIARQAVLLEHRQDAMDAMEARNTELVADNRRLRLALGHERPALALVAPADREA